MLGEASIRYQFERWAEQFPRNWSTRRYGDREAWPGQYEYHVQCAWEAWITCFSFYNKQEVVIKRGPS